ncbi:hypothetical protein PFMC_00644 [Plasmodium falciparum CAMP/Malaysia]|uniref:Uncharacterized protein n=1 Tax=Plasmodium falciparum (isolate Camp / Malaysia) TaxID=5835 RepID=A0A024XD60_PLAFC|nr:hypothetical protein PFMC_00644 [Plasmodium falciparum CAMP/Malaysia]
MHSLIIRYSNKNNVTYPRSRKVENLFDLIIILNNLELIKKKYIFLYHGRNYEKKNKFIKKNNIFFLYNYTYCVDFNNKYSGINNNIVV